MALAPLASNQPIASPRPATADSAAAPRDPFFRKSLQHFRWPLLPGNREAVASRGALQPVLEVLRPVRPKRNALLPQQHQRASAQLLGALREHQTSLPPKGAGEIVAALHQLLVDETSQRQQFHSWRQTASPC